jgi:hypothetical protein
MDELKKLSGDDKYATVETLKKIASGEIKVDNKELVAAAKRLVENDVILKFIGGDDGKISIDDINKIKDSASVEAYGKSSDEKFGFNSDEEAVKVFREYDDELDNITAGRLFSVKDLQDVVKNPDKYPARLVDAAKYALAHPDLLYRLAGDDGDISRTNLRDND